MKKMLAAAMMLFCFCQIAHAELKVITKNNNITQQYQYAFVEVLNEDYKALDEQKQGDEVPFVYLEIVNALREFGINPNGDEKNAGLKIVCRFRKGFGMPRIIRHFKIKFRYVIWVNIKIIDVGKDRILGEVEYTRPWADENPPDFIKSTIKQILK